ncbi:MAG: DNA glycosylase [Chloroflexi bacterium]|nr:DNA glycosylase [Chloroflexota bacterium]
MSVGQPLDLALSLEMGQAFRWRRVRDEHVHVRKWGSTSPPWRGNAGGWYSGVLGEYLVHLRQTDEGLEYRVGDEYGERHDVDLDKQMCDYFRLDDDIGDIYSQLGRHRAVAQAVERYPGLRLLRQEPWECMVAYLCSGTNSIRGIRECVERIAQLSRRRVRLDDDERHVLPGPVQIAEQGEKALTDLGLGLSSRPRNIFLMATRLSRGPLLLELEEAGDMPGDEAVKLLDSYSGIGPKIASCVALMSLDKLDAFPVDRWVRRALKHCDLSAMSPKLKERVRNSRTMTEEQQYSVAEWARGNFGQYAGYANQYLFHWVEPHKEMVARNGVCRICGTGPPDSTTRTASNSRAE